MKRLHGLSLILIISFLFVASSGFFVFQVWGNTPVSGGAQGLETPESLPTISTDSIPADSTPKPPTDSPAELKKSVEESDDEELEAPSSVDIKVTPVPSPDPAPPAKVVIPEKKTVEAKKVETPKVEAPKPVLAKEALKAQITDKPTKQTKDSKTPAANVPAGAVDVGNSSPSIGIPMKKEPSVSAPKKYRKTPKRKALKAPVAANNELPPEWNWFSVPLHAEYLDGSVKIVGRLATPGQSNPLSVEESELDELANAVAVEEDPAISLDVIEATPVVAAAADDLIASKRSETAVDGAHSQMMEKVLARVESRRDRRYQEAEKKGIILPSSGGQTTGVPQSLIRLRDALGHVVHGHQAPSGNEVRSDNNAMTDQESDNSVITDVVADGDAEKPSAAFSRTFELKSGEAFRVQE